MHPCLRVPISIATANASGRSIGRTDYRRVLDWKAPRRNPYRRNINPRSSRYSRGNRRTRRSRRQPRVLSAGDSSHTARGSRTRCLRMRRCSRHGGSQNRRQDRGRCICRRHNGAIIARNPENPAGALDAFWNAGLTGLCDRQSPPRPAAHRGGRVDCRRHSAGACGPLAPPRPGTGITSNDISD